MQVLLHELPNGHFAGLGGKQLRKIRRGFVAANNQILLYRCDVVTALKLPCFLSKPETLATTNPARCKAV